MSRLLLISFVLLFAVNRTQAQIDDTQVEANLSLILRIFDTDVAEGAYATHELDTGSEKLPENYMGQDPKLIYQLLASKFSKKQEFESTEDYRKRVQRELTLPVIGDLTMQSKFASQVAFASDPLNKNIYDADAKMVMINIRLLDNPLDSQTPKNAQKLQLREKEIAGGTYTGQNAFGATREITKLIHAKIGLSFNNTEGFDFKPASKSGLGSDATFGRTLTIKLPMDSATAKVAKPNLRMLAIYELVEPYTTRAGGRNAPTINSPTERFYFDFDLCAKLNELWIYNFETGEVYRKIKAAEAAKPIITAPTDSERITSPVTIRGRTTPNATIEITVRVEGVQFFISNYREEMPAFQVRADSKGTWQTQPIQLPKPPNVTGLNYIITASQTDGANRISESAIVTIKPR